MHIEHNREGHKFEAISDEGEFMGSITYVPKDASTIEAEHTWVSDRFRGHGVAGKLLDAMAEYAASENLKIIPICSYVQGAFEKDPARYRHVMQ